MPQARHFPADLLCVAKYGERWRTRPTRPCERPQSPSYETRAINCTRGNAHQLVEDFDLHAARHKVLPKLEELAMSAVIFGASQLKPAHQTLFTQGQLEDRV
jgi:hypothetical protein